MSTSGALVTDVDRLRAVRARLVATTRRGPFGFDLAETLAECDLRLALARGTDAAEADGLLREAMRLDGTNPKYAYHLARIRFLHGDFSGAAKCLREAISLCPTSHRLWTHVALLQRELNATYFGDERFEPDALRERADRIEKLIADGVDAIEPALLDFVPPTSRAELERHARHGRQFDATAAKPPAFVSVKRLTRAGTCRWSGIHDLRVEHLLQARPTRRGLRRLVPLLERAAEDAKRRAGGAARFSVLATIWITSGYPVATVHRLVAACGNGAARRLVDLVCELYAAPPAEVPGRLAASLAAGAIPPTLAAVIHRARVLNRPLEFRATAALRAAQRLLTTANDATIDPDRRAELTKEAETFVRRLVSATEGLYPPPPETLQEEATEARSERDPDSLLAAFSTLERAAQELEATRTATFEFLKGDLVPRAQHRVDGTVLADRDALEQVLAALKSAAERGDQRVEAIVREYARHPYAAPKDFEARRDECQKRFRAVQQLSTFRKVLLRLEPAFSGAGAATAGAPSQAIVTLLASANATLATDEGAPAADEGSGPAALAAAADRLSAQLDADWTRLQSLATAHKRNDPPLTDVERSEAVAIRKRVEDVFAVAKTMLERIGALRTAGHVGREELPALDDAEKRLLALGERNGPFRRKFTSLQLPELSAAQPQVAEQRSGEGRDGTSVPHVAVPERPLPLPTERSGLPGLAAMVRHTEREIMRSFVAAEATFAPYAATMLATPAMASLQWTVLARKAETLYRLGRRDEARLAWCRLLRLDSMDLGVRRNLAVCETALGETGRTLRAWQWCVELLYFYDVVADDLRPHVQARVELHRVLANSYAPPSAYRKEADWLDKFDPVTLISFLGSPRGVRNFVGHKLLEYFNTRLAATSPPIVIGIGRTDPRTEIAGAVRRWQEFRDKVAPVIPERLRSAVTAIAKRQVDAAVHEVTAMHVARKPDATYGDDRNRLLELVTAFCELKFRFGLMLMKAQQLAGQLGTFAGLIELLRLDDVPVDSNHELFEIAARKIGQDPDQLRTALSGLAAQFVLGALRFVLAEPADESDEMRRRALFVDMVSHVVPHPAMKDVVPVLDSPHRVPEIASEWLPSDSPEAALPVLRRWHRSFSQMAGVALRLGQALLQASHNKDDTADMEREAVAVLETGAQAGFFDKSVEVCVRQLIALRQGQGRAADALALAERYRDASKSAPNRKVLSRMCSQLTFQLKVEQEQFGEALDVGIAMLRDDDIDFEHARNLLKTFLLAARRGKRDPGRQSLIEAIDGWLARAQLRSDRAGASAQQDERAVTAETIANVREQRDRTLLEAVVAQFTDADGDCEDRNALIDALSVLADEQPDLLGCRHRRMLEWDALAEEAEDDDERERAREGAVADAETMLQRSEDATQRAEILLG